VARGWITTAVGRHEDVAECLEIVSLRDRFTDSHIEIRPKDNAMNLHLSLSIAPIVALIAGILILIVPRLLNYIIAIYLIVTGLLGLFGTGGSFHMR
jgi:hypothetical protein